MKRGFPGEPRFDPHAAIAPACGEIENCVVALEVKQAYRGASSLQTAAQRVHPRNTKNGTQIRDPDLHERTNELLVVKSQPASWGTSTKRVS